MPNHREQQLLPYTSRQLFDLVADIEHYPEFLPWCTGARVLERNGNEWLAELAVRFNGFSESYVSRVRLTPPETPNAPAAIEAEMVRGPFQHLINRWAFTPANDGTNVDFFLDFKFRSFLLEKLIGGVFAKATDKMVAAFCARADQLYRKS